MGWQKVEHIHSSTPRSGLKKQLTVADIRESAKRKEEDSGVDESETRDRRESFNFNIFDGTPDKDSPWAMFIDPESDEEENPFNPNNESTNNEHEQYDPQAGDTKRTSKISNSVY